MKTFLILTALITVISATEHQDSSYSFVSIGQIVTGVSYGSMVVDYNMKTVDEKATLVTNLIDLFAVRKLGNDNSLIAFARTVINRAEFALRRYENTADMMFERQYPERIATRKSNEHPSSKTSNGDIRMHHVSNIHAMADNATNPIDRRAKKKVKRQAMALAAVGLLGAVVINGLLTQGELATLARDARTTKARQEQIVTWIEEDETTIRRNSDSLDDVKTILEKEVDEISILILGNIVNMVLEDFHYDISLAEDVIQAAMNKKMSQRLLNSSMALDKLKEMAEYAELHGHDLLIDSVTQLMQLEVGFVLGGRKIQLIMHVPMAQNRFVLNLKKFLSMPIKISDNAMAMVTDPDGAVYLGWSITENFYVTLTPEQLRGCDEISGNFFCKNLNVLRRKESRSCLIALYEAKREEYLELCEIHVARSNLNVVQLTHNEFAVFSIHEETYTVVCPVKKTEEKKKFKDSIVIFIEAGCYVTLGDYRLISRPFAPVWGLSASKFTWEVSFKDIFGETGVDEVTTLLAGWTDRVPVSRHVLAAHLYNSGHMSHVATWIILGLLALTLIAVVAYIGWSYRLNAGNLLG
jgi:hypothetical protein